MTKASLKLPKNMVWLAVGYKIVIAKMYRTTRHEYLHYSVWKQGPTGNQHSIGVVGQYGSKGPYDFENRPYYKVAGWYYAVTGPDHQIEYLGYKSRKAAIDELLSKTGLVWGH